MTNHHRSPRRAATTVFGHAILPWAFAMVVVWLAACPLSWARQDGGGARVYFFSMEQCPPCRQMEPMIDELIRQGYPVTKIDARSQAEWTSRFQVTQTPTLIFTIGNREVAREQGLVPLANIQAWFLQTRSQALSAGAPSQATSITRAPATDSPRQPESRRAAPTQPPQTAAELAAMRATVRLKIDDGNSYGFGTGTVIHSHDGESLVLTCGHLFRESGHKGVLTADVDWTGERPLTVPAELISYDADANDVALIVIRPGFAIPPVPLAPADTKIPLGEEVFSIGCDKGAPPTIRQTSIKNHAIYDGSKKYDTVGRPTIGRSGGGLFRRDGSLIGVCNAAAVREDEGIFTSLDNVYTQINRSGLAHLFPAPAARPESRVASQTPDSKRVPRHPMELGDVAPSRPTPEPSPELLALAEEINSRGRVSAHLPPGKMMPPASRILNPIPPVRQVSHDTPPAAPFANRIAERNREDYEMIVVVRSKQNPRDTQTLVINAADAELLQELRRRSEQGGSAWDARFAELRSSMPEIPASAESYRPGLRAQSPDNVAPRPATWR